MHKPQFKSDRTKKHSAITLMFALLTTNEAEERGVQEFRD